MQHPLIRYHGGKFRLAPWIISHFPNHETYVEPFGGGASVLLCKEPSRVEVYNDLDNEIVNFFEVLRDPIKAAQLARLISLTPYSRFEYSKSREPSDCEIERARKLVIRAQMGFGSAGATKRNTGFRLDTARGGSDIVSIWERQPELLTQAASRFKRVLIENREALKVLHDHDRPETLFFVDPPYIQSTRSLSGSVYKHEMSDFEHEKLIDTLKNLRGKVILCGYENDLYNSLGWQKVVKPVSASGQIGSVQREEILWINPRAEKQQDLFSGIA